MSSKNGCGYIIIFGVAGPTGIEPATPGLKDVSAIDWMAFREALEAKNYRGTYASEMFNFAAKYADCLLKRDFTRIKQLPCTRVQKALCGVSALAKYLGVYDDFRQLIKQYGLAWQGRSTDDLIIARLSRSDDPDDVFNWIREVKAARPEYSVFMDFIAVTGLRLSEAVHSYNLIIELTREKTLTEKYYNEKTGFLEHFRFRDLFLRSTKKAFISFVPLELLEKIGTMAPMSRVYLVRKSLTRHKFMQRFSDVRELNATWLVKYLREVEIDVLHGRVSGSVFKTHYLNVKLISDLRQRAAEGAQEILAKIVV